MFPDGLCQVTDRQWAKTLQYEDITYQLAQDDDKAVIFDGWCDFLNYFDPSVHFQLSFVNLSTSEEHIAATIDIPPAGDEFDSIRAEYTNMLRTQGAKGNNGLSRVKYIKLLGGFTGKGRRVKHQLRIMRQTVEVPDLVVKVSVGDIIFSVYQNC